MESKPLKIYEKFICYWYSYISHIYISFTKTLLCCTPHTNQSFIWLSEIYGEIDAIYEVVNESFPNKRPQSVVKKHISFILRIYWICMKDIYTSFTINLCLSRPLRSVTNVFNQMRPKSFLRHTKRIWFGCWWQSGPIERIYALIQLNQICLVE